MKQNQNDAASKIITRFFRNMLEKKRLQSAKSAFDTMRTGTDFQQAVERINEYTRPVWDDTESKFINLNQNLAEKIKDFQQLDFQMISRHNLTDSFKVINPLAIDEQSFLDFFIKQDFYLVHATNKKFENNDGHIQLKSRTRLLKDNVNHVSNSEVDIDRLKNEDYVFFSLEIGEPLWKSCSRFGQSYYKIKFHHEPFKYASMVLLDQLLREWVTIHIEGISTDGKLALEKNRHRLDVFGVMFHGRESSIYGLAYNIISTSRLLPEVDRKLIITARDPRQLNAIINSFFRPEIRIANIVNVSRGKYTVGEFPNNFQL
ncbi:hypothetical protein [Serratia sp. T13T92]|uniref:hypothetical protein n=1 Tax=Serratia sp. T13T92 TaxID=3397496 RepID=UPI0039DFD6A7